MALPKLKKQQVILIAGGILALAAMFMIKMYIDQERARTEQSLKEKYKKAQANQTPVLVAKRDIARGQAVDLDSLQVEVIPNKYVQPQAVTSLDRISGMTTTIPIAKGEQITLTKLTFQRSSDLASLTPIGKRAVTIFMDDTSSFGGMIKAGDYVDVISMVPIPMQTAEGKLASQMTTVPLFQNVLVLALGQNTGTGSSGESRYRRKEGAGGDSVSLITLALNPQEANITAFVQEQGGKIRLVLRSPSDAKVEPVQLVTWDTLFQYIIPQEMQKKAEKKEETPPSSYVEIYRGLNKEKVPLYK